MRRYLALLTLLCFLPLRGESRQCTPEQLSARLSQLESIVHACSAARSKAACDPALVGDDLQVALPSGSRLVEFDWLRSTLSDVPTGKNAQEEMAAAEQRLARDLAELSATVPETPGDLGRDHAVLRKILASPDFPQPQPRSLWQRLRDQFNAWLSSRLSRLGAGLSSTHWISQLLLIVVVAASCGGLLLWFSRATRRQRLLIARNRGGANSTPVSIADWQLWLTEAHQLAMRKQWREAIHRLYWAAIAAMEARGAWRPDSARTPREYLALVDPASGSKDDLLQLTRSLERFWYGGEAAGEIDYDQADALAGRLVT